MKFKTIPKEYIKVILDRLIRLKPAYERYDRVFSDILNKFLIIENKEEFDFSNIKLEEKIELAVKIFNRTVGENIDNTDINDYIKQEEDRLFNKNNSSTKFLEAKINLKSAFNLTQEDEIKDNLRLIKLLISSKDDPKKLRKRYRTTYPVEKILLCEGATEEILLEKLSEILNYDFKKEGIFVLGAGGKNQVARKYYKMIEDFKIPIFVLLDEDAGQTKELILPKLRTKDKIHLIKKGEFEDIIPKKIIIDALNKKYSNSLHCSENDFDENEKMTKNLHEIFRKKGFGEYKKADFAKALKEYMQSTSLKKEDLSEEIIEIMEEIKKL